MKRYTSFVPKGMLVDAKTTSASNLMKHLDQEGSGFSYRGDLAPKPGIIKPGEERDLKTYGDVKTLQPLKAHLRVKTRCDHILSRCPRLAARRLVRTRRVRR